MDEARFEEDARVAKLPKWVQDEFRLLRSKLSAAETKLAAYHGETETEVHLLDRLEMTPLPKHSKVRFDIAGGEHVEVYVSEGDLTSDRGVLVVRTVQGQMRVDPCASNVIHIRPGRT